MDELFTDNGLKEFVKFDFKTRKGRSKFPHHKYRRPYIQSVDTQYSMEVGEKQHRLHAHAVIEIKHRSQIQLDYAKLRLLVKRCFGQDGHVNGKLLPSRDVLDRYIRKSQPAARKEEAEAGTSRRGGGE